jgi:hypothetical protein
VRGRNEKRIEVAGSRLSADVLERIVNLRGVEKKPVPKFPFPPLVDAASGDNRLDLVVSAKRLRLLLLREDEFDFRELGRDVSLTERPIPDEPERRNRLPNSLCLTSFAPTVNSVW